MNIRLASILATVATALLLPGLPTTAWAQTIIGVASVVDGDTIEIHGQRIRLHGIDAPESGQECTRRDGTSWRCGQEASLALAGRIGTATVRCEPHGHDRNRRIVAVCFQRGENLNRWMVTSGWAVAYRKYSLDYVADEEKAHRAGLRLWSGTFEMPWDRRLRK